MVRIELDTRRRDAELKGGAEIVIAVDQDLYLVGVDDLRVAPHQRRCDAVGRVERPYPHVDRVAHEEDPRFGTSRRRNATLWVVLGEVAGNGSSGPHRVIERAIEFR